MNTMKTETRRRVAMATQQRIQKNQGPDMRKCRPGADMKSGAPPPPLPPPSTTSYSFSAPKVLHADPQKVPPRGIAPLPPLSGPWLN